VSGTSGDPVGTAPRRVPCPRCGRTVEWTSASRFRPFCSERCKLLDLGAWATGSYRIPDRGPAGDASQDPEA